MLHFLELGQYISNIVVVGRKVGPGHQHMKQCIQWVAIMNRLAKTETLMSPLMKTPVSNMLFVYDFLYYFFVCMILQLSLYHNYVIMHDDVDVVDINFIFLGKDQMKKNDNADTLNIEYDYASVMHYSRWQCALSKPDKPSMTYKQLTGDPDSVGQRQELSSKDIQHIKVYYCAGELYNVLANYYVINNQI